MLNLEDYQFQLPPDRIASTPANPRDQSRLMVLNRRSHSIRHDVFTNLTDYLTPNDVLVLNDSKVFPARLMGHKASGGVTEILLLRPLGNDLWQAIARDLKTAKIVHFGDQLTGYILDKNPATGEVKIRLESSSHISIDALVDQLGQTPIPPYITSPLTEANLRTEYQTVYARSRGSAAAPTAGLHFTQSLLDQLSQNGIQIETVTLHVGLGTFAKLHPDQIISQSLHPEWYSVSSDTAARLRQAKTQGKRIIAVGTTTCRVLESDPSAGSRSTQIFIMPPYQFKFVDGLITNFHLPQSSLLMLVTAFTQASTFKQSFLETAYQTAIDQKYRFFSFGDAMLIE